MRRLLAQTHPVFPSDVCPLSLEPLNDSAISLKCGHTYNRDSIVESVTTYLDQIRQGTTDSASPLACACCRKPSELNDAAQTISIAIGIIFINRVGIIINDKEGWVSAFRQIVSNPSAVATDAPDGSSMSAYSQFILGLYKTILSEDSTKETIQQKANDTLKGTAFENEYEIKDSLIECVKEAAIELINTLANDLSLLPNGAAEFIAFIQSDITS